MKKYELGLGRNYVADWNVWSGIREFIQNAIDQSKTIEDNEMSINYDETSQVLTICNKKSILEHHTLLLGSSSKKDDGKTIGMFGEGYKLALLVLTREGKKVTIFNYGKREVWTARFSKLKKYDYMETLIVEVDTAFPWKKVPNHDLTVQIEGITPEEFEIVKSNTLFLKGDYTYFPTKYGNILEGKQFAGQIYINGLKVCDKPEFKYGYDIKPAYLKIGRDRNLLDTYDIKQIARKMWLLSGKRDIIKTLLNQDKYKDCEGLSYDANWYSMVDSDVKSEVLDFADELFEDYIHDFGTDTICAYTETERATLQRTYKNKKVVVISDDKGRLIRNSLRYENMLENIEVSEQSNYDKLMNWATENNVSESDMEKLFEILKPLTDTYEEATGKSFFEEEVEEKEAV